MKRRIFTILAVGVSLFVGQAVYAMEKKSDVKVEVVKLKDDDPEWLEGICKEKDKEDNVKLILYINAIDLEQKMGEFEKFFSKNAERFGRFHCLFLNARFKGFFSSNDGSGDDFNDDSGDFVEELKKIAFESNRLLKKFLYEDNYFLGETYCKNRLGFRKKGIKNKNQT